jgi:hypothetical protein
MKMLAVWKAGETVPFLITRCEHFSHLLEPEADTSLKVTYEDVTITVSEWSHYSVFDFRDGDAALRSIQQFHEALGGLK